MYAPALHQLHSHGWMYMIDLQCVKTCQKQIRRKKNMSMNFICLLRLWFMACLLWRRHRHCVINVLLRLSVCFWEGVSQCSGHVTGLDQQWAGVKGWMGRLWHSGHALQMFFFWMLMRGESTVYTAASLAAGGFGIFILLFVVKTI